jgi:hypothetical protein
VPTWTVSGSIGAGYTVTDAGTLTNSGSLDSPVTLDEGALLINASGGTIAGTGVAITVQAIGAATVTNADDIADTTYGLELTAPSPTRVAARSAAPGSSASMSKAALAR